MAKHPRDLPPGIEAAERASLKEAIFMRLSSSRDGFVDMGDAALWLVQYPVRKCDEGDHTESITAMLMGFSVLGNMLDEKYGPLPLIKCEGGWTPAARPNSPDYRRDPASASMQWVSIELLRAAALKERNAPLVALIDEAMVECERVLGTHQKAQGDDERADDSASGMHSILERMEKSEREDWCLERCIAAGMVFGYQDYSREGVKLPKGLSEVHRKSGDQRSREAFRQDVLAALARRHRSNSSFAAMKNDLAGRERG